MSFFVPLIRYSLVSPTIDEDFADGYHVGDLWVDTVLAELWMLLDSTNGAAVWIKFNTAAGLVRSVRTITDADHPYTVKADDDVILVNNTISPLTVNMTASSVSEGREITAKKISAAGGLKVTIVPFAGDLIDGFATIVMSAKNAVEEMTADGGTGWWITGT